jgi:potassium-transporting ATPase potassium-binding subunit
MYSVAYILLCLVLVAACIKPLGGYMARVYMGRHVWTRYWLGWLEQLIYRLCGVNPGQETGWRGYALAIMVFGFFGFILLFLIFLLQGILPLNPQHYAGLRPDLAFNAAISFVTNTNWQSYSGEAALSYFSQTAGIVIQNFLSAATGLAVAVALFRGLAHKQSQTIGNPFVDIVRSVIYILLPLSFLFAILLASQGVIQNFNDYIVYSTLENETSQLLPQGPVASQVAIKMLGSNGGGFFGANSAHPFENPTPLSNLFQTVAILLIPAALVYCFGVMIGDRRQAWTLLTAMIIIFMPLMALTVVFERSANPRIDSAVVDQGAGNLEGKEVRIGTTASALWAVATTATSNGSVNSMHDSYTPLGSMIPLLLIQFGEVIFGGVGTGAYGMLIYVILTVFIGGLMVGRTPEYMGKKLGAFEIKMASLCIIIPAAAVLLGTAIAVSVEAGRAAVFNPGAQGFTEILYALSSASNNNGSAMAGLAANSPFYNIMLAIAMLVGRYGIILPVLAIAGSLAAKNRTVAGPGTLPTHTPLFVAMLVGSILLLDVLTYVPVLAMGPLASHIHLYNGEIAVP